MYLYETIENTDTKNYKSLIIILILLVNFVVVNTMLAIPEDTIKVAVKNPEANAPSIYQINFQISKPISQKAVIKIKFPLSFDLSGLLVAGSSSIKGGFEMTVENQSAILKRTGLGKEIKPNEEVDVKIAIVINPEEAGENYLIQIEVFDDNNERIIQKLESIKITPKKE